MVQLICPVCGERLRREKSAYICPRRHSFDIARSGYVNLLPSSGSGRHGDDKLMVRARTQFLDRGYYLPLAERLAAIAAEERPGVIVDAGCGEGYYTDIVSRAADGADTVGLDISKDAVAAAAKRCRRGTFAVASTVSIPLEDCCADMVLNVFSPFFPVEFARVLKPGGTLVRVIPLERHLHELRQLVYDSPYDNDVPPLEVPGFERAGTEELRYAVDINNGGDISNLFMMTPYYYKTSAEGQARLRAAQRLTTQIEFGIVKYKKP